MHQMTQNHFLKFSIHLFVRKSQENYRQINGKSKASLWRNLSTSTPPNFLGQSFALQLQFTIYIFFRKAVMWKLFDTRFSYKHCNFLRVCLLFKMASKTVTRSILPHTAYIMCLCFFVECYATKSLQQPRAGLQCAQGSKAISQFLDGCAPTPPAPPPKTTWLYTVNSQQFIFRKFYHAIQKNFAIIESKSSQSYKFQPSVK